MSKGNRSIHQNLYDFDQRIRLKTTQYLAGIDEVGRGCLAGPVVAACVLIEKGHVPIEGINDSKKISATKREELAKKIKNSSVAFCISAVENTVIDQINIRQATLKAMRESFDGVDKQHKIDEVFVDGEELLISEGRHCKKVVKGDSLSYVIASASIVAKVWRDQLMLKLHQKYPLYGFDQNKGYGTKLHREALCKYGGTPCHRWSFNPLKMQKGG